MGNCYKKTLKKIDSFAKKVKNISSKIDDIIPDDIDINKPIELEKIESINNINIVSKNKPFKVN